MATPIPFGFVPPTIKNNKDVSKLTNLEYYLYTPSEIATIRKNYIDNQKKNFEHQYKRSLQDAVKVSAIAFSIPMALSFYVDKKKFNNKKSTLIIVSPLILSGILYFLAPKWS